MEIDEIAAVAQLIHNAHVSQVDGQTPGHRVFGRAPKLPVPCAESATFCDIKNGILGIEPPETRALRVMNCIYQCRILWQKLDTDFGIKFSNFYLQYLSTDYFKSC